MISSNCSIKLLDKAYIGLRVRMTSDKSTEKFDNVPMKGMKIEDYSSDGFRISHPNLPKSVWVDFKQLPLTNLTIINGVIQDEITFVENIRMHQMELIKTDMLDYIELVHIRENEKTKEFTPITQIKAGDVVKSALCNGGGEMIFLGLFHSKEIVVRRQYSYSYYGRDKGETYNYHIEKNSPRKAYFLVKSKKTTVSEVIRAERESGFNPKMINDYHKSQENQDRYNSTRKEYERLLSKYVAERIDRFEVQDYAVTSKVIKNVVKTATFDERFKDEDENLKLLMWTINRRKRGYHMASLNSKREDKIEDIYSLEGKNYVLAGERYGENVFLIQKGKDNLLENTIEFTRKYYGLTLTEADVKQ